MKRRAFLQQALACTSALALAGCATTPTAQATAQKPNIVIIFTDDQGYNDLGCFGSPHLKTPRIDQMAAEGMRFTDFYSAAPVCTPSRAALMTGCYAQRLSMAAMPNKEGTLDPPASVLFPWSRHGIHSNEILLPEILKAQGYATGCVGKWHLGHLPPFLPTRHGFDYYFGIPYSNDMVPTPILRNEETIQETAEQDTLVETYTQEAIGFIESNKDKPFFLYFPHNFPHVPLHTSKQFAGTSEGGLYGDVIAAIDWSVGKVLDALKQNGLDDNTLVIFTSDNGPWLTRFEHGGFAFPLRGGKGSTFEGGMREPCVMRWPGVIPAGTTCKEVASTIDLLPTIAKLAGTSAPTDRIIDGKDILPLMRGDTGATSPHEAFFYYQGNALQAVRSGLWKLRVEQPLNGLDLYTRIPGDIKAPESLYNLFTDPGEQKNVIKDHPDIAERLRGYLQLAREDLGDTLTKTQGKNVRPIAAA